MNCNTITEAQKAAWMREGAERERERIAGKIVSLNCCPFSKRYNGRCVNPLSTCIECVTKLLEATP